MKKRLTFVLLASLMLLASCAEARVRQYGIAVKAEYAHDDSAFTQGLFFGPDGMLYESTGMNGESSFRKVDLATGKVLRRLDFNSKYFVEGSVMKDGKLFVLTWGNKVAFVYDASTLEYIRTYAYPREGWGLTTDGKHLIASDGSSKLYFLKDDFTVERTVSVTMDGRPVRLLNELEYIDGKIWANVYTTDMIVIINPSDGKVEGVVDCSGLLPDRLRDRRTDVLNGIAYNPADKKTYLTGKYWKRLYEIELKEKKQ